MSAFGDILNGLKTVMELTGKVEKLTSNYERLNFDVREIDRRLIRVETIIEVTRSDGATLRIARDPD
jgi:hypothetical protein